MDRGQSSDVIVVGAGIVGLAAARRLAIRGLRVLVVERSRVAAEASGAAAGMLAPQAELDAETPLLPLALAARDLYPALVDALEEETGIGMDLSRTGFLELAFTEAELARLDARHAWQQAHRLPVERLTADEVRDAEPNVNPALLGALFLPADRRLDNVRLTRALAVSATRHGAAILAGRPVHGLRLAGGRVAGVVAGGETFAAPAVVNASGAWLGGLAGDPQPPPVFPVRGQMVAFDVVPPPVRHVVAGSRGYVVPRSDGRTLAGSTSERAGYAKTVTAAGLRSILDMALELLPCLADVPLAESWSGLRPATPDNLPVIGPGAVPGLVHAGGLYRNGILLGPLVGEIAAGFVLGEEPAWDVSAFAPGRFA